MSTMKKKILKRANSMRRPAKRAARKARQEGLSFRKMRPFVALAALIVVRKWRRARRSGKALRNAQGVGPAHIKGVPRAEEQGMKHPHVDNGHAAGHLIGSVDPS
jgi:hypothetical protein